MTNVEILGYVAQFLFVSASFSQARKCYIEGNASGLSWGLMGQLIVGFFIMFYYVPMTIGYDMVLLSGYAGQLVCIFFMLRYKVYPRLPVNELTDDSLSPEIVKAVAESTVNHDEPWVWSEERGQYISVKANK